MMMIMLLVVGGIAVYMFRGKLGLGGMGGGGVSYGSDSGGDDGTAAPAPAAPAGRISAESGFPAVSLIQGMQYIANQVVNDIDRNTYAQFTTRFILNLEADILEHHKSDLSLIWNYNGMSLQPLQGRALAAYAQLVLQVARENGIALNPAYEAMLRTDEFAGSPIVTRPVTALSAVAIA